LTTLPVQDVSPANLEHRTLLQSPDACGKQKEQGLDQTWRLLDELGPLDDTVMKVVGNLSPASSSSSFNPQPEACANPPNHRSTHQNPKRQRGSSFNPKPEAPANRQIEKAQNLFWLGWFTWKNGLDEHTALLDSLCRTALHPGAIAYIHKTPPFSFAHDFPAAYVEQSEIFHDWRVVICHRDLPAAYASGLRVFEHWRDGGVTRQDHVAAAARLDRYVQSLDPDRTILVDHAQTAQDPERQALALCDQCGVASAGPAKWASTEAPDQPAGSVSEG